MPFYGPSGGGATLEDVLEDFDENRALIMWTDCQERFTAMTTGHSTALGVSRFSVNGTANQESNNSGGLVYIATSGDAGDDHCSLCTYEKGADYAKDPRIKFKCSFETAQSGLQAQGGGFNDNRGANTWDETNHDTAMFRSLTTGNLFAVTGDGSSETTTDLGSVHTLGDNAVYEIASSSNGGSYAFKINGTTRATHTGTLPNADMRAVIGIAKISSSTTSGLNIEQVDYMYATQDRT